MKIFNILKKTIKDESITDETTIDDVLLKALIGGEDITRKKALDIPIVNSCVGLICDTFATIPIKLYKKTKSNGAIKAEEVTDERVKIINSDTKDTLDGFQFKRAICEDYLLGKGGYAFIKRSRNKFTGLNYVEEQYVTILKNVDKIDKYFKIFVDGKEYDSYQFIKLLRNTKDGATGDGMVSSINKSLQSAYQRILLENDLMKTCGNKKGFLRAIKHLDEKAMEKLKRAWNDYYDGNASCIILNDGMEFKEASNTSVENQLDEKTKTFADEIKDLFRIRSKYDDYIKEAIIPITTAFCTSLNRDFLLESEKENYYFAADLNELLKGSLNERYEAYKTAIEMGILSRNEVRYKENLNKVNGLDTYSFSLGDVLLDPQTGNIYTPNTDSTKKAGGGENKIEK